jgi:hypothetical protein
MQRVADVAATKDGWCINHDVDQRRDSPWPDLSLRDAIARVDRWGFNAIDHTVIEFSPVDDSFVVGTDPSSALEYFEFTRASQVTPHVQTWKSSGVAVDLARAGGHEARFEDRRVFPFNFLLRHYPVRSQGHGERKVFRDRQPRYPQNELERGWHRMYLRMTPGHRFLRATKELIRFDEPTFQEHFLLPRLARLGVPVPPDGGGTRLKARIAGVAQRVGLMGAYRRASSMLMRMRRRRWDRRRGAGRPG